MCASSIRYPRAARIFQTAACIGVSVGAPACVVWAAAELNNSRFEARTAPILASTDALATEFKRMQASLEESKLSTAKALQSDTEAATDEDAQAEGLKTLAADFDANTRLYKIEVESFIRYTLALNSIMFPLSCCSFALISSKLGLKRVQFAKRRLGRSMLLVPAGWLGYVAIILYMSDSDPEPENQTSEPVSLLEQTTRENRTIHGESAGMGMISNTISNSRNVSDMFFFAVIAAPVGEEMFFRHFVLAALATSMHPVLACCVSSAAFGAVHSSSRESEVIHIPWKETLMGLVFGGAYLATGRIAVPVLMHAMNNGFVFYAMRATKIIDTDSAVTVNDKGDLSILFTLYVFEQAYLNVKTSLSRAMHAIGGTERDGIFKVNPMVDRSILTKTDPTPLTGKHAATSVALALQPFEGLRTGRMTEGMKQLAQQAYTAQLGTGSSWSFGAECFFEYRLVTLCTVLKHVAMSEPGWNDMKVHELLSALLEMNSPSKFETLVNKFTPTEARQHDIARRCCLSEMYHLYAGVMCPQIESLFTAPGEAWYTSNATNRFLRRNENFELTKEEFVLQLEDGVAINDSGALMRMVLCYLLNMNKNPSLSDQALLSGSLSEALRDFWQRCEAVEFVEQDIDHEFQPVARVSTPYMCESRSEGYRVANINLSQLKVHIT